MQLYINSERLPLIKAEKSGVDLSHRLSSDRRRRSGRDSCKPRLAPPKIVGPSGFRCTPRADMNKPANVAFPKALLSRPSTMSSRKVRSIGLTSSLSKKKILEEFKKNPRRSF
jgi:hypothetical protein